LVFLTGTDSGTFWFLTGPQPDRFSLTGTDLGSFWFRQVIDLKIQGAMARYRPTAGLLTTKIANLQLSGYSG